MIDKNKKEKILDKINVSFFKKIKEEVKHKGVNYTYIGILKKDKNKVIF